MQGQTNITTRTIHVQPNETLAQTPRPAPGLQVKTRVKAGGIIENHNETLVRVQTPTPSLKVKTQVKAGTITGPGPLVQIILGP